MCEVLEEFFSAQYLLVGEEGLGPASTLVTLNTHTAFKKKKRKKNSSTYQMSQVPLLNQGVGSAAPTSHRFRVVTESRMTEQLRVKIRT